MLFDLFTLIYKFAVKTSSFVSQIIHLVDFFSFNKLRPILPALQWLLAA